MSMFAGRYFLFPPRRGDSQLRSDVVARGLYFRGVGALAALRLWLFAGSLRADDRVAQPVAICPLLFVIIIASDPVCINISVFL